jgi:putative ABC transport system permease protein
MWNDLVIAVRSFARTPRFTIPAVLAVALGIGSTSAIFSVVNGVMLTPLPYRDPDRIVVVWENNLKRNRPRNVIGAANFVEWIARTRSLDHLAMVGPARLTVMIGGQPEEVAGLSASSGMFPALGVAPSLGRAYGPTEDIEGHHEVVVLGHDYWRSRFNGSPDVVSTKVMMNGVPRTILGVMPPGFTVVGQRADFLIPYGWTIERLRSAPGRGSSFGIARLRDGVSLEQATSDMTGIAGQLEKEFPRRNAGWSVTLVPVHEQTVDQIRPALLVLSGAVGLVLLIACVNVANLLLARSTVRQRELGVRTALGARRGRLVRQMLTESLLLGAAGGAAGLALAFIFHRGLIALAENRIPVPRLEQVALNAPVLLFTVGLSLLSGLLFGVVPAWVASGGMSAESLREGGRHGGGPRSRRILGSLVVAEVALSLILLAGAGLLIRSFMRLQQVEPGFRTEGVFTARVQLPGARYDDDRDIAGFHTRVVERMSTIPGVRSAAGVTFLPFAGMGIGTSFYVDGTPEPAPGEFPSTDVRPVTPGFFRTMGIPQLAGRDISVNDRTDTPRVAVITETLARRYFAGENPVGRRLNIAIGRPGGGPWEIVGVIGDIRMASLEGDVRPAVFLPHTQLAIGIMTYVARGEIEPMSLASGVSAAVREIDPEIALGEVRAMDEVVDATLARPRAVAALLTAFALMALILAGVGVYGVMAYSVAQRTQEIGVRMALGATPQSVFRLIIGQALRLVAIGVVAGLVAAGGLTRLLGTLLYETEPLDPVTFGATGVLLIAVASIASYVPARRGTRVAPVEALRAD